MPTVLSASPTSTDSDRTMTMNGVVLDVAQSLEGGYNLGSTSYFHIRLRWTSQNPRNVRPTLRLTGQHFDALLAKKADSATVGYKLNDRDVWVLTKFSIDF